MMAKKTRNSVVLAKLQTTAGTAAQPAGATDAVMVRSLTATPLSAEFVERELLRPYMGNSGQIATTQYAQLEFEVELAGAGTAGKAPAWGPLLRACGFAETVTVGTDVRYLPVSTDFELITLHYFLDGLFHKIVDARGTVAFDLTAKSIPVLRYRFMGAYVPITDGAMPAGVDFSAFQIPKAVNKANTPAWSLGAYSGCLQSMTFDVANQLVWRSLIGCEGAEITDRKPTGKLVLELPRIADLDWPTMVLSGAGSPLSVTHGVAAGHIVEIKASAAQMTNPTYSDQEGVAMLNLDTNINPGTAGNDELEIIVK
ncbi:phage tail tube protein [Achromobacter anxifer]